SHRIRGVAHHNLHEWNTLLIPQCFAGSVQSAEFHERPTPALLRAHAGFEVGINVELNVTLNLFFEFALRGEPAEQMARAKNSGSQSPHERHQLSFTDDSNRLRIPVVRRHSWVCPLVCSIGRAIPYPCSGPRVWSVINASVPCHTS